MTSPDLTPTNVADLFEEDAATVAARAADPTAPSPAVGALLAVLAGSARAAVEVGSASGVTGRWLLKGMADRAILTSLEPSRDVHDRTAEALADAAADGRARPIQGDASVVLGRLADDGYQLVLLQTDPAEFADLASEALRVLAPGGVLVARGLFREGVADPQPFLDQVREAARAVTVLPLDEGLLVATL